jgi:hypothetical protein
MALAAIRTAHTGIPLFVHVLGAMMLVGTLIFVASAILYGWGREDPAEEAALTRHGLRAVFYGVLPAYVVMRVGAQWMESAVDFPSDYSPVWLDVGYITADAGALLILVSLILAGIGLRRLRGGRGIGLARAVGVIAFVLICAYVVAVWAMAGKPV